MSDAQVNDSPTAWFVLLERARRSNDAKLEAKALAELRRLGVDVRFDTNKQGGTDAATR